MPNVFAVYDRGCYLKKKSSKLTIINFWKIINNEIASQFAQQFRWYIFRIVLRSSSVHPPFILRSSSVRAPFNLRSTSVRAPFKLRSTSVRAPFNLRSGSVQPPFFLRSRSVRDPFGNRRLIEEWSKKYRRIIGGKTDMYRNSNGKPRERRPEQKLYFLSLKFKLLWKDLLLTSSLFCAIT